MGNLAGQTSDAGARGGGVRDTQLGPHQLAGAAGHPMHRNFQSMVRKKSCVSGHKNNLQRKPTAVGDHECVKESRGSVCPLLFHGENRDM